MRYDNITQGVFISRPNRFTAIVSVDGRRETVHVKNTGRCRELLIQGCTVWLTEPETAGRKTRYDLVAVEKSSGIIFNIDSQAPNKAVLEWLEGQGFDMIKPEYAYGRSRVDVYMERGSEKYLLEVKGCTLEKDGVGYFPDAPTERGVKHIRELIKAKSEGYNAALGFVIQTEGVREVRANTATHPEFGEVLEEAKRAGVKVLFFLCSVSPDSIVITEMTEG